MPDAARVTVLRENFSRWVETASLEEVTAILIIIGRELVTTRAADGYLFQAGRLSWKAAEAIYYAERPDLTGPPFVL